MSEPGLLLTDLYQFAMLDAYAAHGMNETSVFELFVRKLPDSRGFLLAAGLEQAVRFLESLHVTADERAWLAETGLFTQGFVDSLADLRFTGDLDAMPEGTVFFPDEPILRVTAPLREAQIVETRLINLIHFQTVIASAAARMVLAAPGKQLIDFGLRRAHGAEAGLLAARAAYLAGFDGTATVLAKRQFGIPIFGTMAHSFIQVHDDEEEAFVHFARARPHGLTLLIDTYDTERGAGIVVRLARRLAAEGITIRSVRIDSGDPATHARHVRAILDAAGLQEIGIFASGGLNEAALLALHRSGAPIDGFGIGTSLATGSDAPALDCAYKLQAYAGRARRKRSEKKATWPGAKQVWRRYDAAQRIAEDRVALLDERGTGEALLQPVMRGGRRLGAAPSLSDSRAHAALSLTRLPEPLRRLEPGTVPVMISDGIRHLASVFDREMGIATATGVRVPE